MENLNTIPKTGSYGTGVDLHNDNYSKIGLKLETLENMSFNEKGYFETLSALQTKYPTPQSGWQAYVKDAGSSTGYYVANVNSSGNWVVTSAEAPAVGANLNDYALNGGSEKTLKEVEDEIVQLAGSMNGIVAPGEKRVVQGSEVFIKTLTKGIYLDRIRATANLFNKDTVVEGKRINPDAPHNIIETAGDYAISDYIFLEKGKTYTISGWFSSSGLHRIPLFTGIGETTPFHIFTGITTFTTPSDCYVVVESKNNGSDKKGTLQLEEGDTPTPYEPYSDEVVEKIKSDFLPEPSISGRVEENNEKAVSGGEVFKKTLTKDVYLEINRKSVNLFDKNAIIRNKRILPNAPYGIQDRDFEGGEIYSISDYIPVSGGVLYSISGWFASDASKRVALFTNIGETIPVEIFLGVSQFTPTHDSYAVVDVTNANSDFLETLQIQVGEPTPYEPYSDEVVEKIKSDFLPEPVTRDTAGFNLFKGAVEAVILNPNGTVTASIGGELTTKSIRVPEVKFLFISGLNNNNAQRVYKFYKEDGSTFVSWVQDRFNGDHYRIPVPNLSKTFRIQLTNAGEYINLDNVIISPYKELVDSGEKVSDIRNNLQYRLSEYKDKDMTVNDQLNIDFEINSSKVVKNALIPIFLHKGSRPQGASILERHVYLGDSVQNDFSDVIIGKDGRALNARLYPGNYSLVPYNSFLYRMFQDKTDGYILGSNFYQGIYKSVDDGRTWSLLKENSKIIFMAKNGDIFFQVDNIIKRATKSSNFIDENIVYQSPYTTLISTENQICQDDDGNIYYGTYQNEWHCEILRSTDAGSTFSTIFFTSEKQHVHKLWHHDGKLFMCLDGATLNNPNDEIEGNTSLANYVSFDKGETWELVKQEWSSDCGVYIFGHGFYYGVSEANIKYAPSLFRSKDLKNWEIVFGVPANTQSIKEFEDTILINMIAYRSFSRAQTLISGNGRDFIPIFDTKNIDSMSMEYSLRRGTSEFTGEYFVSQNGEKWLPLCSESNSLDNYKFMLGGDNYQALALVQCDLEEGKNVITIKNGTIRSDIRRSDDNSYLYKVEFRERMLISFDSMNISYPDGSIISDGRFAGHTYPYELRSEVSVNLSKQIILNRQISGVKSIRFGYKAYKWNDQQLVSIFNIGDYKFARRGAGIVLLHNGVEYALANSLRPYYDTTCLDIVLSFDGAKLAVYLNGYKEIEVDCIIQYIQGDRMIIQSNEFEKSADFISDIELYDYVIDNDKAKELFEGFNIV